MKSLLAIILTLTSVWLLACTEKEVISSIMPEINHVKLLALGDSYTIGQSVAENNRWPNLLAEKMRSVNVNTDSVRIIAKTGWRTDNLASAIAQQNQLKDWNLVGLLIGVNNQYQGRSVVDYGPEFEALLQTAIELAGGDTSHVFVVSIPDYGYTPFGQSNQVQISAELDEFNDVNRTISMQYGVAYYNITPISREGIDRPELVASDNLHPSGVQYREWVESFYMQVAEQLR
jgi:lysophospholipase L1-like esterase